MNPDRANSPYLLARNCALKVAHKMRMQHGRVVELHTTGIDAERHALKDAHIVAEN